ncbi:hemerythrin domain-containing protein [Kribbella speibonae]|nr:hemerythrin domain-containing protein [Kribbella speibonae]
MKDRPADIDDMRIVHSALRRDLERVRIVASDPELLTEARRQAIGEHVVWLMHTLHRHHHGEDEHVWPEIRRRDPAAGALLDQMDADHRSIAQPMRDVEDAGDPFGAGTMPASELLDRLARLQAVLLPHLAREEQEMMPVVAKLLSYDEWHDLGHRAFVRGKPLMHLAMEGHWVLDNATPEDRARIITVLPAAPRFVLLHLLGGPYAKRRESLWSNTPAAALPPLPLEDSR